MDLHGYFPVYSGRLSHLERLTRAYREGVYHISVKNPGHVEKGVKKMIVDGKEVAGHVIPYNKGQKEYSVEVIMG